MTQEQIITELESLVRQSKDAALLNKTVYDTFLPLFDNAFDDGHYNDGKTYERSRELYSNVFQYRDQAKRMEKEAELFQSIIDLIQDLQKSLTVLKFL